MFNKIGYLTFFRNGIHHEEDDEDDNDERRLSRINSHDLVDGVPRVGIPNISTTNTNSFGSSLELYFCVYSMKIYDVNSHDLVDVVPRVGLINISMTNTTCLNYSSELYVCVYFMKITIFYTNLAIKAILV